MEATVAERGQITLPKAVRDALGLSKGSVLKVELDGGRIVLSKRVDDAISRVREGAPLSRALAAGGLFPPMMIHMIASGEATGELAQMLQRTAATLSGETERRALAMTGILEPLLILVMGVIVLVIVLAVLLPIIEINQLVR